MFKYLYRRNFHETALRPSLGVVYLDPLHTVQTTPRLVKNEISHRSKDYQIVNYYTLESTPHRSEDF